MPLNKNKLIAFDVETGSKYDTKYALQPFRAMHHAADITSYATAAYDNGTLHTHAVRDPDRVTLSNFLQYAIDNQLTIIGWNVAFDAAWLIGYGLETQVMQARWLDGMLLWQHLTREPEYEVLRAKKQSYGLKAAVAKYIPKYAGYGDGVDFFDNSPAMVAKRLQYNKLDAALTLRLTEKFYSELEKASPQSLRNALIEASAIAPIAQSIVHGLHVDVEHARAMQGTLAARQAELGEVLEGYELTDKVLASPKQLSAKLYDDWGLPVLSETAKGGRSTDKVALHLLAAQDERVAHIREYRECANNRTKFVDKILDSVAYNEDGCTRPWPRIYGTYSGRVVYNSSQGKGKEQVQTGFALHQMKRAKDFRKIITAPPGYVLCEWDAAGQEYRWMAVESADTTMLTLCEPGQDPHSYMGAEIAHRDYFELVVLSKGGDAEGKNIRQMGKVGNLSCIAEDEPVLTDRGFLAIQSIQPTDRLWDGDEWVVHDGVVFMGEKDVIEYGGVRGTLDHLVRVRRPAVAKQAADEEWVTLEQAARNGWPIASSLGADWASIPWTALRVVGGVIRRTVSAIRCAIREGAVSVRPGERSQLTIHGDRAFHGVPVMREQANGAPQRQAGCGHARQKTTAETRQRHEATVPEPTRPELPQLWGQRDRVSVCVSEGWRGLHTAGATLAKLCWFGLGPHRRKRALRTGQLALGHTEGKPRKQKTYDILNAGARNCFSVRTSIVHNCQYRIGVKKLWVTANVNFELPLSMEEAQHILGSYHRTYPGVQQYWARQIAKCRRSGYAETLAGRRVQLTGSWINRQTAWQLESTAVNFPIQGIGADQKYLAIRVLQNYLRKYGGRFYFELHDGLYAILPERKAEQAARVIRRALSNLPYQKAWGFTPPIPLPWDLKMGANWGEMAEVGDDE